MKKSLKKVSLLISGLLIMGGSSAFAAMTPVPVMVQCSPAGPAVQGMLNIDMDLKNWRVVPDKIGRDHNGWYFVDLYSPVATLEFNNLRYKIAFSFGTVAKVPKPLQWSQTSPKDLYNPANESDKNTFVEEETGASGLPYMEFSKAGFVGIRLAFGPPGNCWARPIKTK